MSNVEDLLSALGDVPNNSEGKRELSLSFHLANSITRMSHEVITGSPAEEFYDLAVLDFFVHASEDGYSLDDIVRFLESL